MNIFKKFLPLFLLTCLVMLLIFGNYRLGKTYSGWDNIHAEFNLGQYTKRVVFGGWLEHQGLGGPSAQGHTSEITRLPWLYLLSLISYPEQQRYFFISLMYWIGGITLYFYVAWYWIKEETDFKYWIAALASIFYLLHILTIQQFYIAFEMFTVQFAFFPLVLISLHYFYKNQTAGGALAVILAQLAIAPSAHTPTVAYLGLVLTGLYALSLSLNLKQISKSFVFVLKVVSLLVISNSFWIIPSLTYTINNASNLSESRANQVFNQEALWSIRESGTLESLITNIHYLFEWNDFNFRANRFEPIFFEWSDFIVDYSIANILVFMNLIVVLGIFASFVNTNKITPKFPIVLFHLFCMLLIWPLVFPTSSIVTYLYEYKTFLEVFRNPFTKLSILYSLCLALFFASGVSLLLSTLEKTITSKKVAPLVQSLLVVTLVILILLSAAPTFNGQFINEKLFTKFPDEYTTLFEFLKTKDTSARIVELPYFSNSGWVYHNWQDQTQSSYQGIGFYFFGAPQSIITPDFARWVNTNDFFYQELDYALSSRDPELFAFLLKKYRVSLVLFDETRVEPLLASGMNPEKYNEFLSAAGLKKEWSHNFLHVYSSTNLDNQVFSASDIPYLNINAKRVFKDSAYIQSGDYLVTDNDKNESQDIFPFSQAYKEKISNFSVSDSVLSIKTKLPPGEYILGENNSNYEIPIQILSTNNQITLTFPQILMRSKESTVQYPLPPSKEIKLKQFDTVTIVIGGKEIQVNQYESFHTAIPVNEVQNSSIKVLSENNEILAETFIEQPNNISNNFVVDPSGDTTLEYTFPITNIDISKLSSTNCSIHPQKGFTNTIKSEKTVEYISDQFGVNCVSFSAIDFDTTLDTIVFFDGQNIQGRSVKLFLHTVNSTVLPKQVLLNENQIYYGFIAPQLKNIDDQYILNWETRSFGAISRNRLNSIMLQPYVGSLIADISLKPLNASSKTIKAASTINQKYSNDLYKLVELSCSNNQECYFVLNQSYDPLWFAVDISSIQQLTHQTFNSWANAWIFTGQRTVIIFFLTDLLIILSLLSIILTIIVLLFFSIKRALKQ